MSKNTVISNHNYHREFCDDIIDPKQKKPKCAQYWPAKQNEMELFDHMQIKLLGQSIMKDEIGNPVSDIHKRNLEVSNGLKGISKFLLSMKI